jgi:hypothetical protein
MNLNLNAYLGPTPLDTDTFLTVLYVEIDDFRQRKGLGGGPPARAQAVAEPQRGALLKHLWPMGLLR